MRKLILILGTGQGVLEEHLSQQYRTADYYFEESPENIYTTPFVGEAIINAKKEEFDSVYIFGTKNSMWETVYDRAIGENASDEEIEFFYKLADKIKSKDLTDNCPELKRVSEKLSEYYGVGTECKLLDVGINLEERWKRKRNKGLRLNQITKLFKKYEKEKPDFEKMKITFNWNGRKYTTYSTVLFVINNDSEHY